MDISNHSGDVLLKWEEPVMPNGLIVTYQIEYRRIDIENVRYLLTSKSLWKIFICLLLCLEFNILVWDFNLKS